MEARPLGELARLAVTERVKKKGNTPQHPVPCHSERALGRVELLRHAAKALWALAPCGIWDGLLCLHLRPARSSGRTLRPSPSFHSGFDSPRGSLKMTRGFGAEWVFVASLREGGVARSVTEGECGSRDFQRCNAEAVFTYAGSPP